MSRLITAVLAFHLFTLAAMCGAEDPALGAGTRPIDAPWSRSAVYGRNGMAATAHPLASQAAIDILKQGGSAVDAAIAANAALGLMEPTGNGIGGDLFAIVWDPASKSLHGYNSSGRSPRSRNMEQLLVKIDALKAAGKLAEDHQGVPSHGSLSVTVPGTVDGWFALHQRFGKLAMKQVLEPAIHYAREGHPIAPVIAWYLERSLKGFERRLPMIEEFDNARATWFARGAPQAGELFRNPDLADTLEILGNQGRDAFYKGTLARTIDAYMRRIGGDLRYDDFANHQGEWVTPGSVNYRGYDVYELPPNGQGFAALQMLSILKNVKLNQWPRSSPEVFHYMVEAKRLAFEDVGRFYADPTYNNYHYRQLLTDAYGQQRFKEIDPNRALASVQPGDPKLEGPGDTTYLTVADKNGMMVSLIQSNYRGMGSGLVPDGLGFMLQDRGELFSLDASHPNVYAPGKRPFHTIIPAFVMRNGQPWMSFGLMGGAMQPQGHVQVLVNMIDFGMNVQEAGDAARFNHQGGRQPTGVDEDLLGILQLEPGVPAATADSLEKMGHRVKVVPNGAAFGGYQAIQRDPDTGVYTGATEMRKDGTVAAY